MNAYRAQPRRVADRVFLSCGVYDELIVRMPVMVHVFEAPGMQVRHVEARDGHSRDDWRDRLCDSSSWIYRPTSRASRSRR